MAPRQKEFVPQPATDATSLPDEVLDSICCALEVGPLLNAGAVAMDWRHAATRQGDAWRLHFGRYWRLRQKPACIRPWWHELVSDGVAEQYHAALTATGWIMSQPVLRTSQVPSVSGITCWHQRFVHAIKYGLRISLSRQDLCEDLYYEMPKGAEPQPYLRRWVLARGELDDVFCGDEIAFLPNGLVEPRSSLLSWQLQHEGTVVVLKRNDLDHGYPHAGYIRSQLILQVHRDDKGGFVLCGHRGHLFFSREKTEMEHQYRKYGIFHAPKWIRAELESLATRPLPSPYVFSPKLTAFERLAIHRVSDELGLSHESHGVGLERNIVVWR